MKTGNTHTLHHAKAWCIRIVHDITEKNGSYTLFIIMEINYNIGITNIKIIKKALDELYTHYNNREYVYPDPLIFLYDFDDIHDREIAGLVASSLAYGRVQQIIASVEKIIKRMNSPSGFLENESNQSIMKAFRGFKHRFTTDEEISLLLIGMKKVINKWGSLENCFKSGLTSEDITIINALANFVNELRTSACCGQTSVLPCPSDGSACKRWNLYLKWMIRHDEVDPGGWNIPASKLIIPLDVHMFKLCTWMGFTQRKHADMKTALEITSVFREIEPLDPTRYDFALTRLGIRNDFHKSRFVKLLCSKEVA